MNVLESLIDLHCSLEACYMRTGIKTHLEPDAFYRLFSPYFYIMGQYTV